MVVDNKGYEAIRGEKIAGRAVFSLRCRRPSFSQLAQPNPTTGIEKKMDHIGVGVEFVNTGRLLVKTRALCAPHKCRGVTDGESREHAV